MPSVAVVEGPVVGSGCEIAAACDFIVATPAASFRIPEAIRGTVGATQRLPRILGKRLAKDMMFTGRTLGAEEAERHGLVARLVAPEKLETVLAEIAKTIVEAPPQSLRLAKRCIDRGVELDPQGALDTEIAAIEEQLASGAWLGKS
jgi:enoyl-CoA hydratase